MERYAPCQCIRQGPQKDARKKGRLCFGRGVFIGEIAVAIIAIRLQRYPAGAGKHRLLPGFGCIFGNFVKRIFQRQGEITVLLIAGNPGQNLPRRQFGFENITALFRNVAAAGQAAQCFGITGQMAGKVVFDPFLRLTQTMCGNIGSRVLDPFGNDIIAQQIVERQNKGIGSFRLSQSGKIIRGKAVSSIPLQEMGSRYFRRSRAAS